MIAGFPLLWTFTVPWADVDMLQHVNNVAYIRWIETIRCEYFTRVIGEPINGEHGMILAQLDFAYEQQLRYHEEVTVGCSVSRIGNKSFDMTYEVWSNDHSYRAAHGKSVLVAYDFRAGHSIKVPDRWRSAIAAFEAGPPQRYE
ncbi:MAG TPA: thioesterase family protein [Candidatus Tyrphobacter sp.]